LDQRPDVVRQRLAVRVRELELLIARNALQPQLDVHSLWRVNGLGDELSQAIGQLTDNQFTDWELGISLSVPLGYRQASAQVQSAELLLDREHALLRQTVHATTHQLSEIVRQIDSLHQQLELAEQRLEASNDWLEGARIRFENPPPAAEGVDSLLQALNVYLLALRSWSNASIEVSSLLARYNRELARLEEAKGTLLATNNIQLQEDPITRVRFAHPRLARADLFDAAHP
jgi:outer membrane protein TolC